MNTPSFNNAFVLLYMDASKMSNSAFFLYLSCVFVLTTLVECRLRANENKSEEKSLSGIQFFYVQKNRKQKIFMMKNFVYNCCSRFDL